jgi:hypothetical protein
MPANGATRADDGAQSRIRERLPGSLCGKPQITQMNADFEPCSPTPPCHSEQDASEAPSRRIPTGKSWAFRAGIFRLALGALAQDDRSFVDPEKLNHGITESTERDAETVLCGFCVPSVSLW